MITLHGLLVLLWTVGALCGLCSPAMATPSDSAGPVKTPTKALPVRVCMMCGDSIATTTSYYKVDVETGRRKENRRKLGERFSKALGVTDIVDVAFRHGIASSVDSHLYACTGCCKKLDTIESAAKLKKQMTEKFNYTCTNSVSSLVRQKRMAVSSPSSTSSRQPKRSLTDHTEAPKTIPSRIPTLALARGPRSLFGNISNIPSATQQESAELQSQVHLADCDTTVTLPPQLNPSGISSVQVIVQYKSGERKRTLPEEYKYIGHALCRGTPTSLVEALLKSNVIRPIVVDSLTKEVNSECDILCSKAKTNPSLFRQSDITSLLGWSYSAQEAELKERAPILHKVLQAAATNKKALQKTNKVYEDILRGMMTAAGTLLYMRSNRMNAHAMLTGLSLKRGNADSMAFKRLHRRGLCASYNTVIRKQEEMGRNHDKPVLDWGLQVASEAYEDIPADKRHPSYLVVGDNIDFAIKARHTTSTFQRKEYHLFNSLAIKNRVSSFHLPDNIPVSNPETISMSEFLPSSEDESCLRDEWCTIVGRIICEHLVKLQWMEKFFPQHIKHQYSTQAKKKSEVVPLGIIMENENTKDGMASIVEQLHKYVPGSGSVNPLVPILSKGDLLTCEKEASALENRRDGETEESKLEGLMPVIADFHAYGNFLEVIWDAAYDTMSPGDAGTLYHARVRLKAHSVTKSPMKCFNAADDLLQKYAKSLLVAAGMTYFGMDSVEDEPTQHTFQFDQNDEISYARDCMYDIVDTFILPSIAESTLSYGHKFACHLCNKKYVTRRNLKKHMAEKHKGQSRQERGDMDETEDSVRNYCCSTLSMCMVALAFTDARKHGDGGRIIRHYKFLLLFFLGAGKTKYAHQTFRLLAQVKCLLSPRLAHELTWCRFVNNKGRVDSNIEPDREIEHSNRGIKDMCRGFHGHMTKKSIDRVSRSSYHIEQVLYNFDTESGVKRQSGKHNDKLTQDTADINSLGVHLHDEEVFVVKPGRRYKAFTSVPRNWITSQVDPLELQVWMKDHLKKLTAQNMFRRYTGGTSE